MKYFLHDSNAFNDEKISELFINFGYEGLGLFYTILEKLASQEKPIKTIVLKSQLKVGKKLEKCWNFMETIGLISSNNGETFNEQLLKFSEKYKIKSEKNAKRISEWRNNQSVAKSVTHSEQDCNTPKVKESKVNEIEVKESKDINTEFSSENLPPQENNKYSLNTEEQNPTSLGGGAKKVNKPKIELVYPFESEEFMKWWNVLMQSKKWSKKPITALQTALYKLQNFDEQFSIELIQTAIQGDYAGLVFGNDTQVKFNNYKNKGNGTKGTNGSSRAKEVFYESNGMFDADANSQRERFNQSQKNGNTTS